MDVGLVGLHFNNANLLLNNFSQMGLAFQQVNDKKGHHLSYSSRKNHNLNFILLYSHYIILVLAVSSWVGLSKYYALLLFCLLEYIVEKEETIEIFLKLIKEPVTLGNFWLFEWNLSLFNNGLEKIAKITTFKSLKK